MSHTDYIGLRIARWFGARPRPDVIPTGWHAGPRIFRMGALRPWHVAVLGCCCLVVVIAVVAVVFFVVKRGKGKSGQGSG